MPRTTRAVLCVLAWCVPAARVAAQGPAAKAPPLPPIKFSGPPTTADITPIDLMTRLYIFADDSMAGRVYNEASGARATAYIERQVRALGLKPGGDSGSYFQNLSRGGGLFGLSKATPPRNVIAIFPGSDEQFRGQYVAVGAHSDHVGTTFSTTDHDVVRATNALLHPQGADFWRPMPQPDGETAKRIRAIVDSLHKLHPPRHDSVFNGADDDGSGSVALLEIAEALAKGTIKTRRSIIMVWHAGEEAGMLGSKYFLANPTVPRDSIVAQLNMDMIGRGGMYDVTGVSLDGKLRFGGDGYLQLVGSRRLSTELGDLVEAVNAEQRLGFVFDYELDEPGHPQQIYCRSDHMIYAGYGIPIVFFTTGGHADYHQVTDEPQYIDYDRLAHVGRLVFSTAVRVANLDHRVKVDKPAPAPGATCVQ